MLLSYRLVAKKQARRVFLKNQVIASERVSVAIYNQKLQKALFSNVSL